jgi:hypothetical protein
VYVLFRPDDTKEPLSQSFNVPLFSLIDFLCSRIDASNDAHCAVVVHKKLLEIAQERGINVDVQKLTVCVDAARSTNVISGVADQRDEEDDAADDVRTQIADDDELPPPGPPDSAPPSRTTSAASLASTKTATQGTFGIDIDTAMKLATTNRVRSSAPTPSRRAQSISGVSSERPVLSAYVRAGDPVKPRALEAYRLWHLREMTLHDICREMRDPPLKEYSVVYVPSMPRSFISFLWSCRIYEADSNNYSTYVVGALQSNESLEFDKERLRELVNLDDRSRKEHGPWMEEVVRTESPIGKQRA